MDSLFSLTFLAPNDENESRMPRYDFSAGPSSTLGQSHSQTPKKRRNKTPDLEDADIIALSPTSLMNKNKFICEVCNKGFPREQNLQLHIRGHDLPWNLKAKGPKQGKRKLYVCPEASCPHHDPSRGLGDLTGLKKHYLRKHSEKKYKCNKCTKKYAVLSDCKAHSKTCGTRVYTCVCAAIFSRRQHFVSHQTTCDALPRDPLNNPSTVIPRGTTLPLELSYIATAYRHQPLASPQPPFVQPQLPNNIEENEVPLGFLYPNQSSSSFDHGQLQKIPNHGPCGLDQLRFDSNENDAASSSYANFVNFRCFPDNGTNFTSAVDNNQQYSNYGFEDPFNLVSSGNYTSEEISRLYITLPQAINQNPSTAQMSAHSLLQNATNQNANNFGSYGDNGTGYLHDIVNPVACGYSSSIIGRPYNENLEDMNSERFHENLAAVGGEGNYMSEEIASFHSTSPQSIKNQSTAQMSGPAFLQNSTQFGSTSSTCPGATNPINQNANNFGTFGDNGTGYLQDIVNLVTSNSYTSIFGGTCLETFKDNNSDALYFHDSFHENLAAVGGEDIWFGILKADVGSSTDLLGMMEQRVNTNVRDLNMSSLDLQAGNIGTLTPGQHFGDI